MKNEASERKEEDSIKDDQDNFVEARDIRSAPNKRKRALPENRLADILQESIQSQDKIQRELSEKNTNQDQDKLFCLSLYKELKKVPENKRLAPKIELLEVIERGQTLPSPVRIISQQSTPNAGFWQNQQNSNQLGYFTG